MASGVQIESRDFRPGLLSLIHYLRDFALLALGGLLIFASGGEWLQSIIGAVCCLGGLLSVLSTRALRHSRVVVTPEQLIKLTSSWQFGLRWDEMSSINIRQQPDGLLPGRVRRLVVIEVGGKPSFTFCPSVFTREDEEEVLSLIRARAQCPVRESDDG